jgi:ribosomal protein S18 acetylase RimI-like enzyme
MGNAVNPWTGEQRICNMPAPLPVTLRPVRPEDEDILFTIYASTRERELALVDGWSSEQKQAFLRIQFEAQWYSCTQQFPSSEHSLICLDEKPIGCLWVDRGKEDIFIVEIALLPDCRNRGIGTAIFKMLMAEAQTDGKSLLLTADRHERALPLYLRLGFFPISQTELHIRLQWDPAGIQSLAGQVHPETLP